MAKITFLSFYSDYSIGVYVLSNILQNCGHDVSIIYFKLPSKEPIKWFTEDPSNYEMVDTSGEIVGFNADVNHWTDNEVTLLTDKILELSPNLLCISSRCTDKELVLDILPKIKSRCNVMMIAGGFGPSIEPELYLNLVDYVYRGEAENMILKIVSAVENGRSLSRMDNMCYKKDGKIIYKKLCLPEIDQFKYQSVPVNTYYIEDDSIFNSKKGEILSSSIAGIKTHSYSTFVGRGCINTCSYCSALEWNKMYAREKIRIKKRRNRPLEDVIEELKSIKDNAYTFVQFRDEFLFADIKYLKRFFYLYEREICLPFWAYLVPQQVSDHPELLKMAVDAGLVATEVGFQSGSGEINRNIFTRYMTNRKFVEYAKLLEHYNLLSADRECHFFRF